MTNQLITILARKHSKRLPNKSLLPIDGKPLIQHTVDCATNYACKINKKHQTYGKCGIVLSTDSKKILTLYDNQIVTFERSDKLAGDNTPKMDSIREAVKYAEGYYDFKFDAIIDLDVTNPMRTIADIENAVLMFEDKKPFSLISVVASRRQLGYNLVWVFGNKAHLTLPVATELYGMNASILILQRDWLMWGDAIHPVTEDGNGTAAYIMNENSRTDIDNEIDYLEVKARMENKI